MGTTLSTLAPPRGATRARKRRGRGQGTGQGTTGGRGEKGQGARAGGGTGPGFEGGQMPLQRRLPKRGFKNPFRVEYVAINVGMLGEKFVAGQMVDPDAIRSSGLAPRRAGLLLKVLGEGEITHALAVKAHAFSKAAAEKIQAAGGSVEVIPTKARRVAEPAASSGGE